MKVLGNVDPPEESSRLCDGARSGVGYCSVFGVFEVCTHVKLHELSEPQTQTAVIAMNSVVRSTKKREM